MFVEFSSRTVCCRLIFPSVILYSPVIREVWLEFEKVNKRQVDMMYAPDCSNVYTEGDANCIGWQTAQIALISSATLYSAGSMSL